MSFFHVNVKSLPKHYDELDLYLNSLDMKFSFLAFTETWLNEANNDLYGWPGYNCINKYRKGRKGGGVSLAIQNKISYKARNDLEHFDSEMESLFIEIDSSVFSTTNDIVIGVIYRMPDSSVEVFNERINDIMNTIQRENKTCYLLGDLNIDFLKCDGHKPTSDFLDTIYSHNLFPLITKPTRVTNHSATLIDHILTNNFGAFSSHFQGILCSSFSDHYAVFHVTSSCSENDCSDKCTIRRDMKPINVQKFVNEIQTLDWCNVSTETDAQLAYSKFHTILSEKYNRCFPLRKTKTIYHDRKPWLTVGLRESIKIKNKLYVGTKRGQNKEEKHLFYKQYRNKLNHLLRSEERKYYQDMLKEHRSNIKRCWQIIKLIINKNKNISVNKRFKHNGKIVEDGKEIADIFNNFFVNVGSTLAKAIPQVSKSPIEYIKENLENCFYIRPVTEIEIVDIISDFKDSAAGWDELKPSLIKGIKQFIKVPLRHICNLSFSAGVFPWELKIANVVPIFKSGDDMLFSNYRPVSVLPVFSKVIERLMYNRLLDSLMTMICYMNISLGSKREILLIWL